MTEDESLFSNGSDRVRLKKMNSEEKVLRGFLARSRVNAEPSKEEADACSVSGPRVIEQLFDSCQLQIGVRASL